MTKNLSLIRLLSLILIIFTIFCGKKQADQKVTTEDIANTATPKVRAVPVEAMIVTTKIVQQNVPLTDVLKPLHSVDVVAEVSGKVKKIVKKLGAKVSTRDTLAYIDDKIPYNQYRQAKSQVLSAENNLKITQLNLKSDKELFENGDISKLAYENSRLTVKTAEANHLSAVANLSILEKAFQDTRIVSPISGLISRKFIDLGMMVNPGTPLYRVVDLKSLKIEVGLPQSMVSRVRIGTRARVTISALNSQVFDGEVRFISPQADENSGAFMTEVHIKNSPDLKIRAGMTAKVELLLTDSEKRLTVPEYALVSQDGSHSIYKINQQIAQLTEVTVGETFGSQVVIEGGLVNGDTIVVVGMKNLGISTKVWIETIH